MANTRKAASDTPPDTEPEEGSFERFESLARRLVRVPKKEIDKQREREARKNGA